jgi:hypothetical protein
VSQDACWYVDRKSRLVSLIVQRLHPPVAPFDGDERVGIERDSGYQSSPSAARAHRRSSDEGLPVSPAMSASNAATSYSWRSANKRGGDVNRNGRSLPLANCVASSFDLFVEKADRDLCGHTTMILMS